jgi:hypothetical protein
MQSLLDAAFQPQVGQWVNLRFAELGWILKWSNDTFSTVTKVTYLNPEISVLGTYTARYYASEPGGWNPMLGEAIYLGKENVEANEREATMKYLIEYGILEKYRHKQ